MVRSESVVNSVMIPKFTLLEAQESRPKLPRHAYKHVHVMLNQRKS